MPSADPVVESDRDREKERDRDYDKQDRADKSGSKQKSASASSKAKDLSHVPCKFYKVGGCTAGSSCPFSHSSAEPGTQKEPCAWFVKGNCKFGHKCALAHILPGQSMSMDRKNKKAAQQAASGGSGATEKSGKDGKRNKRDGHGSNSNNATGRNNPLLAGGSTAPTRLLSNADSSPSSRPSMPLQASISPSAPAPPLKDTDFASSFVGLDEMEGVQQSAPIQGRNQEADSSNECANQDAKTTSSLSPAPLPTSAPRATTNMPPSDFGPIGSPPSGNQVQRQPLNGGAFTPGTSPRGPTHLNGVNMGSSPKPNNNAFLSTSPFSAPGSHSVFFNNSYTGGGMPASLGSHAMMGGRRGWGDVEPGSAQSGLPSLSSSVQRSSLLNGNPRGEYGIDLEYEYSTRSRRLDSAVDDGDMEDFIPSSLTDLLTPEERSRRMSRSGSAKPSMSALSSGAPSGLSLGGTEAVGTRIGHRYSSSVPAPSLLGDIKSIWADSSTGPLPGSPSNQVHRGTPSASFVSRMEGLSINGQGNDDMGLSMSMGSTGAASSFGMLNPSNASAAFLPNIHHNYLKSKTSQQPHLGLGGSNLSRGLRGANNPPYTTGTNNLSNSYLSSNIGNQGLPSSASNASHLSHLPTYRGAPSPFDLTQPMHQTHSQAPRPIPTISEAKRNHLGVGMGADEFLSPNSRALQQHAPGQSLPQGLAAGYSRIHALPPLTSPGTVGGAFTGFNNPAFDASNGASGFGLSRAGASSPPLQTNAANTSGSRQQGPVSGAGTASPNDVVGASPGLESVLNKMSYSAIARGPGLSPTPPGLARNVSGRYQSSNMDNSANGPGVSPLRPRDDDDELFAMDK